MTSKRERGWINRQDMAASIGITPQGFDLWGVDHVGKVGRETFYTVADVLANRIEKIENKSSASDSVDKDTEQARLDKIIEETKRLRLQNSILEGSSLPSWVVTEILTSILSQSCVIFDTLSANIHRKHPEIEKRVIDSIESEIIKHMNEVARLDDYIERALDDIIEKAEKGIS